MIYDSCPNCNGRLSSFDFNCGYGKSDEVSQEYLCTSCEYCSYTFTDSNMVSKIKNLLLHPKKTYYQQNGKVIETTQKFIVTCNNEIIENYFNDGKDDNVTIIKNAPSVEEIQAELNKKYELKLENIIGFDDIKNLIRETVNVKNKKKVNLLIAGYPGTAKTVFLLSIKDELENQGAKCHYIDCANLTGAGIMDHILTLYVNKKEKIDFLLLDEIDKVDSNHQRSFLNMLQTGIVKSTKKSDMRETRINFSAIATANDIDRIYKALFDRFLCVYVPAYDRNQFFSIGEAILIKKYQFSEPFAKLMTLKVWQTSRSMRRIDDIAILIRDEDNDQMRLEKLDSIIKTLENRRINMN